MMQAALMGWVGPPDSSLAKEMTRAMQHRGDHWAWCHTAYGTLGLVWPNSHGDGSSNAAAVGLTQCNQHALAFAGFLTTPPPALATSPPASLAQHLLEGYTQDGLNYLTQLKGAFTLALLDRDKLVLMRDTAGGRTLYHGRLGGRHVFAAEPKGIWSLSGFHRQLRPAALAQYFTFSFLPGHGTMLENLWEVPAGTLVHLQAHAEPSRTLYAPFEKGEPDLAGAAADMDESQADSFWRQTFRDRLGHAISARLPAQGDVPAFLSGGIDSSVVVTELARQAPGRVHTYAVHFGADLPNELSFAAAVAERCGTHHHEIAITPRDFLPELQRIVWHMDEPIGDPVTMPNFMMAGQLPTDTLGIFNGEGGDPCFGGPKNIPMMMQFWYGGLDRSQGFLERAYLAAYRRAYEAWPILLRPEWLSRIDARRDLEAILTPFLYGGEEPLLLRRLMAINIRLKGAHLILPKVERMLAAHNQVPLSPLFDETLLSLAFSLPPARILQHTEEKMILKQAYGDDLPSDVVARPKSGMRVPVHYWFRDNLRRYARHMLNRRHLKRAGIFEPTQVKRLLDYNYEAGRPRYGLRLWMLITFELWRRMVFEGERP